MKQIIIYKIFYILLLLPCNINAQSYFQKTYGGPGPEFAYSIQQTNDGGFIITGSTKSFGTGSNCGGLPCYDVLLIKTDSICNTMWIKTYGGTDNDYGIKVIQTDDSGYIISGETKSFGTGLVNIYLIKTDANGDTLWTKAYGGTTFEEAGAIQQTIDGGYIIAGAAYSFGQGEYDVYLIRTDNIGDTLWTKTFGSNLWDVGKIVKQTADSGFIITGYKERFDETGYDVYLIRTDYNGDTLWTKTYNNINDSKDAYFSEQTSDNGFIITGTTRYGAGLTDVYLLRTDEDGNTLWAKTYGGTGWDYGYCVKQTTDGGFIITGMTEILGAGEEDVLLMKTDINGNVIWSKTYGGVERDRGWSVLQTADGGYIIAGHTESFGVYGNCGSTPCSNVYLIKVDSLGNAWGCNEYSINISVYDLPPVEGSGAIIGSGAIVSNTTTIVNSIINIDSLFCDTVINSINEYSIIHSQLKIFPNPFSDYSTIEAYVPEDFNNAEIVIYNLLGIIIKRYDLEHGYNAITVLKNDITSEGIYFYALKCDGRLLEKGKMIIIR